MIIVGQRSLFKRQFMKKPAENLALNRRSTDKSEACQAQKLQLPLWRSLKETMKLHSAES
uniref:Uncharacterized protein n=1 Tax=Curvibacter symbiont subsp. Hydra magnipapillata TaxID=667019 RepID=C9Y8X5_CURXX|nr:hypothetical protein Csp_A05760 [Curvibacter putative symbiont of Hydra magnipapillata]